MSDERGVSFSHSSSSIALTGGTGFIGRYVTAALLERGWRVRTLIRPGKTDRFSGASNLEVQPGTLEDADALRKLVRGCGAVVHLAGAIRGRSYRDFSAVNVTGTERLLDACGHGAPLARFVHISSLAAREPRLSWYARSKHAGELLVAGCGLPFSGLRPPPVYGPEDPALAPIWRNLARGWLFRPGPPGARFSMLHASDLAEAVCRLLESGTPASAMLEIHDGRPGGYSYPELAGLAAGKRGSKVRVLPVPAWLMHAAASLSTTTASLTGRTPILTPGKVRELTHPDWVCDNGALERHLGWAPATRLEQSLKTLPGWEG